DVPLFVTGIPDKFWGQKVVLFIEASQMPLYNEETVQERLNSYEVPKQVVCLPSFIKTPSAKIDTLKTVALYLNSI
ncbi:MAG: o-succinylbenzoate--CoA ligase, partial [Bacteroidota bacterium]